MSPTKSPILWDENMAASIIEALYQVLVSPLKGMTYAAEKRPFKWAIVIVVIVSAVFILSLLPEPPGLIEAIFGLGKGTLHTIPVILGWIAIFLVFLLAISGIFHLVTKLFHGRGKYAGMFSSLSFASIPWVFFAPLGMLRLLLDSPAGNFIFYGGTLLLWLWILALAIIAIRQSYHFSAWKALATFFIPFIILFLIPQLYVAISTAT
jgi:hypothetical protein